MKLVRGSHCRDEGPEQDGRRHEGTVAAAGKHVDCTELLVAGIEQLDVGTELQHGCCIGLPAADIG